MIKGVQRGLFLLAICLVFWVNKGTARADENIVVVLDPGHGGEALGGNTDEYAEKDLTLKVAYSMAEELSKYEGITIYMTRDSDVDMSLEERVKLAKKVNADFFFCLHFNMSEEHTLYGSECWVSAFGENYRAGYDFSSIELEELKALGCISRGVKTRIGKKGVDYYGIIRMCTKNDIPSVIIEHCYLDHEKDSGVIDHDSWPNKYGVADATAVAKYLGLKSEELGVDYSTYEYATVGLPNKVMKPDSTPPENLTITSCEVDEENGIANISFSAAEMESKLMYMTYSLDGGETFLPYEVWPEGAAEADFSIQLPNNAAVSVIIRVSNNYDLYVDSEAMYFPAIQYLKENLETESEAELVEEHESTSGSPVDKEIVILIILLVCSVIFSVIAIKLLTSRSDQFRR